MARSVPPGRLPLLHRVPIPAASFPACTGILSHRLVRIAPRPFPSQVWRVLGRARTPCFVETSPSASRLLGVGMSLSTILSFRCRSAAANCGMLANPCVIRADSEPPGRRPPAPGSHPRRTHSVTEGPFDYIGGLTVGRLTPVPESRIRPHGIQCSGMSLCALLTIANAESHRRRTGYARNPCSFRWNRTPWLPTSCQVPKAVYQVAGSLRGAISPPDLRL